MNPPANPRSPAPNPGSLPRWLKRNVPKGNANHFTSKLIGELGLHTVCDHAKCPNRMECYAQKTATFLILGDTCTRTCRFCSVPKGRPLPPDPDEPRRVAEAVAKLQLEHAVITCVTRDDLPDGGAGHFVQTIAEIRKASQRTWTEMYSSRSARGSQSVDRPHAEREEYDPLAPTLCVGTHTEAHAGGTPALRVPCPTIEVLPSDFAGNAAAVDRVVDAGPDVYNHNTETVPRLFHVVRDGRTDYAWTLEMFRRIRRRNPAIALKTGLMLGMGETTDELLDTLADLFEAGCRLLTLGQYLQPSRGQMPVVRYVPPEEFQHLGELARRMGFERVAAGPFVRSSYHAREMMKDEG
jgi:lipoyl synthase